MAHQPEVDRHTYERARAYLEEALTHMAEAGHKVHDLSEFALERFGDEFRPYLEQFYRDIREERIQLETVSQSLKKAFFGEQLTPGEREQRIREAAYLRAEQRGFIGSDIDDWLDAERMVDEQLAEQAGLVARGREGIASLASLAGKELEGLQKAVANWLEARSSIPAKARPAKGSSAPPARQVPAAPKKAAPSKKAVKKKAAAKKKSVTKAVKKKAPK